VTNRCNSKCKSCNIHKIKRKIDFQPEAILDNFPRLKWINISGGEPFLHPRIEDVIEYSLFKSKKVAIVTNGILTEKIVNVLEKFPKNRLQISISLDTMDRRYYEQLRGVDALDNVIETIGELKHRKFNLAISMTLSELNAHEVFGMFLMARRNDFGFSFRKTNSDKYFQDIASSSPKVFSGAIKVARYLGDRKARAFAMGVPFRIKLPKCLVGREELFVRWDGYVFFCLNHYHIGNVYWVKLENLHKLHYKRIVAKTSSCTKYCWNECYTMQSLRDKSNLEYVEKLKWTNTK